MNRPYIGIGTIVRDHLGHVGRVIGYDNESQIVTIRYPDQKATRVRNVAEIARDIHVVSYKEVQ